MIASSRTIIHSARLVTSGAVTEDGWVIFDGGMIVATGAGAFPRLAATGDPSGSGDAPKTTVIDAAGSWLTPGFIDIHCHGGGGNAFDDGADAISTSLALHRSHGTTRSVLSLVTAPMSDLEARLEVIATLTERDPMVLGAHLEGPFLAPSYHGAHDPQLLRSPDNASTSRLLEAGNGQLRQITIAPELPGGMVALRQFVDAGVAVAVGHTGSNYTQARAAFDAGASILTHAFNAMPGLHHREPGPVAAAIHTAEVILEVINDGVHVHPDIVRIAFASAPERIALITDAMAAAGSHDGQYLLGSRSVTVTNGVAVLSDGSSIAGSTLTMDGALRGAVIDVGLPMAVAVLALTETPARAIGREADLGSLAPGYAADAVLLDTELAVTQVWAGGVRLR